MASLTDAERSGLKIAGVILIAGTGFAWAILRDFTDAVWLTLQTLTTTGYGSLSDTQWTFELKWFTSILMLAVIPFWASAIAVLVKRIDRMLEP